MGSLYSWEGNRGQMPPLGGDIISWSSVVLSIPEAEAEGELQAMFPGLGTLPAMVHLLSQAGPWKQPAGHAST